jgi:L-arabinonolactonase
MNDVTRVFDADNYLGETPIWSGAEQCLYWINCEKPAALHRWSPVTGQHDVWPMPMRIGGFVPKATGGLLVVLADGIYDFDLASGGLSLRAASPLPDHVALHECHCDRQGRLWVGSFDHHYPANRDAAAGFWFRLDGFALTPVLDQVSIANSLSFSPDGRTMYANNARANTVDAYDLDPAKGALSNRRPFLTLPRGEGFCDGATVDNEGGYWLAAVGAGALRRYLPDGTLDQIVTLPFSNPTKPAFGGPDMATLYVTSTQLAINIDAPFFEANGGLFAFRPGVTGIAETDFAG